MLVDVAVPAAPTVTEPKVRVVGLTLALARSGLGKSIVRRKEKQMNGDSHSVLRICERTFLLACVLPATWEGCDVRCSEPVLQ